MATIVQINFTNDVTEEELAAKTNLSVAQAIADVPGLLWKVWIRNPENRESGGIYLFESRRQAEEYVNGPIIGAIRTNPDARDLSIKFFEVREEPSRITRAPLEVPVTA